MSRNLDLNLLLVFDAVMSERNLRKAGEKLGRSQPSISQAVARLRDLTGDQLFDRSTTGVIPTARAEILWTEIRDPLAQIRQTFTPSVFSPGKLVGESVFGLSDDVRILYWSRLAQRVHNAAPDMTLRAIDTNHTSVWQDLKRGKFDLALTVAGQPPPGFGAKILFQDQFCLLTTPHAEPPRTLEAYADCKHLALVFTDEQPAYADEAVGAHGLSRNVVARVSRFDALPGLIESLDAVVALPSAIAEYFAQTYNLVTHPLPIELPPAILKLCWNEKNRNDLKHTWLRNLCIESLNQQ